LRLAYDERGNKVRVSIFAADGKPCLSGDGYAGFKIAYDERGNQAGQFYFGIDGKPCADRGGIAGWTNLYDERGNKTAVSVFGVDGKPFAIKDGYAGIAYAYDERGRTTSEAYLGVDGRPCLNNDGYAEVKFSYDGRGNTIEQAFFGLRGAPASALSQGYHRIRKQFDPAGRLVDEAYVDRRGKPLTRAEVMANVAQAAGRAGSGGPKTLRIADVLPGGEADARGVRAGDIILRYAGRPMTSTQALVVELIKPGTQLRELVLLRKGREITLRVAPGPLKIAIDELTDELPVEQKKPAPKPREKTRLPASKALVPAN
jgi:hypothetical protein